MERKDKQMAELPAEVGDDVTERAAVLGTDRTFHYNPLHDYESVAVRFVFCPRPEGATDEQMQRARNAVYENRYTTFGGGKIRGACGLLPGILQPLGIALVEMRDILVDAYLAFETSFDGSKILSVYGKLRKQLFLLFQRTNKLGVELQLRTRR